MINTDILSTISLGYSAKAP